MEWFRWYVGSSLDPKFRVVAQRSAQTPSSVLAVWAMLLERASAEADRGSFAGFDCESVDAALELEPGATAAILEQMERRGLLSDGRIANWRKRQPLREDPTAAFRKQAQRLREQERYTVSRTVTAEEKRREKKKEEITTKEKHKKKIPPQTRERASATGQGCVQVNGQECVQLNGQSTKMLASGSAASGSAASGLTASGSAASGSAASGELVPVFAMSDKSVSSKEGVASGVLVWSGQDFGDQDFLMLREVYSRMARKEEAHKGYAEYCQLQECHEWPGLAVLHQTVADFAEKDRKWQQGYAPGLPRFLRERWWQRQPEQAPPLTYAQSQDAERRQRAMRLLEHCSDR